MNRLKFMRCFAYLILVFTMVIVTSDLAPIPAAWAGGENDSVLELTLDDVIKDVARYNPLVEEARLEWLINRRNARAAWGDFEPEFVGNYERSELDRENTTLQSLGQMGNSVFSEKNDEYDVGIEGKVFSGGNYHIGYSVDELENDLSVNKEYKSFAGATIKQPLLKGLWFGAPMANIRVAGKERSIAFHNYRKQLMAAISRAESAYWNLAFAQKQHRVAAESVEIAMKLVEDSKERVKIGKMSELDLAEAEAELAIRLSRQADGYQNLLDAMAQLKLLLANGEIDDSQQVRAVDALVLSTVKDDGGEQEYDTVLESVLGFQPEFIIRKEELEKEKIVLSYRKDQMLPELNLKASYGLNGQGESWGESWRKIEDRDFSAWSVGAEVRIPLFLGIRERNELASARLKKEMAEQRLKAVEYEIANSIDALVHRIAMFRKRIENARTVVVFKKRLLDVEFSRLKMGKSNNRLIYEVEEELAEAQYQELERFVRYREAVTQLALLRGSILRDKGFEIMEDDQFVLSDNITNNSRKFR